MYHGKSKIDGSILLLSVSLSCSGSGKHRWKPIEIEPPKYERHSRGAGPRGRGRQDDMRSPRESPRYRRNGPDSNHYNNNRGECRSPLLCGQEHELSYSATTSIESAGMGVKI